MNIKNDLGKAEGFLKSKTTITLYTGLWLVIGVVLGIALVSWVF